MKAVLDTNVLLAAFLSEGVCARLLARARRRDYDLITCPFILQEFERLLAKKFSASVAERQEALALIAESTGAIAQPSGPPERVCRDKDDDHVLACAREGGARFLVTGDKDLLALKTWKGIRVIAPREFELLFEE